MPNNSQHIIPPIERSSPAVRIFDRRRRFDDDDDDAAPDLADVMFAGRKAGGYTGTARITSIKPLGDNFYLVKFQTGAHLSCNLQLVSDMNSLRAHCQRIHDGKQDLHLPEHVRDDDTWREYLITLLERPET